MIKEISGCDVCDERNEYLDSFRNGSAIVGVSRGHRKWFSPFKLTFLSLSLEVAMN